MTDWLRYSEEEITLHSGGRSHWFVDGGKIFADGNLRRSILFSWVAHIIHGIESPHFVGVPRGGMLWAELLALHVGGTWGTPGGMIPAISRGEIILVDDVVTTGASMDEAAEKLADAGVYPLFRLAVVARGVTDWTLDTGLHCWMYVDLE